MPPIQSTKPRVAVSIGDPAGIGPEIVLKAILAPEVRDSVVLSVVGPSGVLERYASKVGLELPPSGTTWETIVPGRQTLEWLDTIPDTDAKNTLIAFRKSGLSVLDAFSPVPGRVDALCGAWAFLALAEATRLCLTGASDALATAPIHKEALKAAGVGYIGHTEMLGGLSGSAEPLTMFETGPLRIFFHSRHVSLRKACDLITAERIYASIRRCDVALRGLGIDKGSLAVAGLNPHCGEHGLFGNEDDTGVAPAVERAKQDGIDVTGPIGADSVFHQAKTGRYDAVLSLYHDQGHIAAKTLDFDRTISLTLGLPFLRSSVDHGTAFDIAGKGIANPTGMIEAIKAAGRYVREKVVGI